MDQPEIARGEHRRKGVAGSRQAPRHGASRLASVPCASLIRRPRTLSSGRAWPRGGGRRRRPSVSRWASSVFRPRAPAACSSSASRRLPLSCARRFGLRFSEGRLRPGPRRNRHPDFRPSGLVPGGNQDGLAFGFSTGETVLSGTSVRPAEETRSALRVCIRRSDMTYVPEGSQQIECGDARCKDATRWTSERGRPGDAAGRRISTDDGPAVQLGSARSPPDLTADCRRDSGEARISRGESAERSPPRATRCGDVELRFERASPFRDRRVVRAGERIRRPFSLFQGYRSRQADEQ